MLRYIISSLAIIAFAALFGFGGIEPAVAFIAKIFFFILLSFFIVSMLVEHRLLKKQ